jgi:hypothetical protein
MCFLSCTQTWDSTAKCFTWLHEWSSIELSLFSAWCELVLDEQTESLSCASVCPTDLCLLSKRNWLNFKSKFNTSLCTKAEMAEAWLKIRFRDWELFGSFKSWHLKVFILDSFCHCLQSLYIYSFCKILQTSVVTQIEASPQPLETTWKVNVVHWEWHCICHTHGTHWLNTSFSDLRYNFNEAMASDSENSEFDNTCSS